MYRPVKSDPEYIDNWVNKLDLLCVTRAKVGFLGSAFFIGVLLAILIVPTSADKYGRLYLFRISLALQLFSEIGMYFTNSLEVVYVLMVGLGICHLTNGIAGMSLILEALPPNENETIKYFYKKNAISIYLVFETCYICLISF